MTVSTRRLYKGLSIEHKKILRDTCAFARTHLQHVVRRSGENYAEHGIQLAATLREASSDISLLQIAILHDIFVCPNSEHIVSISPLSAAQKKVVRRMHQLRRLHINSKTEDLDLVLEAFLEDEALLPLRMAHRLNDIRQLSAFSPALQKQITTETLHMYTAIAGRLGMNIWRVEMENICFSYLFPKQAKLLQEQFSAKKTIDMSCLQSTKKFLAKKLQQQKLPCSFELRIKSFYSTYRKMILKNRTFEELTDRLALRLLVPTEMDCYKALGIVHANMHPIAGKLKDYIGAPKENGYRSIHTVVYPLPGVTEQPIEIQIRSIAMHEECEYGTTAHGQYKSKIYALQAKPTRVHLFRNLESLRQEARSPQQFEEALRQYFRDDHLALFDPHNNLYHLKKPATALDFICHVYPKRMPMLREVIINGRCRSIETILQDGDILQVKFGRKRLLQKDWVHACQHTSSKKMIRTS